MFHFTIKKPKEKIKLYKTVALASICSECGENKASVVDSAFIKIHFCNFNHNHNENIFSHRIVRRHLSSSVLYMTWITKVNNCIQNCIGFDLFFFVWVNPECRLVWFRCHDFVTKVIKSRLFFQNVYHNASVGYSNYIGNNKKITMIIITRIRAKSLYFEWVRLICIVRGNKIRPTSTIQISPESVNLFRLSTAIDLVNHLSSFLCSFSDVEHVNLCFVAMISDEFIWHWVYLLAIHSWIRLKAIEIS